VRKTLDTCGLDEHTPLPVAVVHRGNAALRTVRKQRPPIESGFDDPATISRGGFAKRFWLQTAALVII
jgi:hypothetical protein